MNTLPANTSTNGSDAHQKGYKPFSSTYPSNHKSPMLKAVERLISMIEREDAKNQEETK